jgi:hypothetical protein
MSTSNDQKRMAEALSKLEGSNPEYTGDKWQNARSFIRRTLTMSTSATNANGSNAIAANASLSQYRCPSNGRLVSAYFIPSAAATANASNYATIDAFKSPANGAAGSSIATITTKPTANSGSGNLAAGAPVALVVTDTANARFTAGQVLAPAVSMTASGVALVAGTLELTIELEGPVEGGVQ